MHKGTLVFNRQLIRLGKGMIKAWEQWVDDSELEALNTSSYSNDAKPHSPEGAQNGARKQNGVLKQ